MPKNFLFVCCFWFTGVLWFPHLSWGQLPDHSLENVNEYLEAHYNGDLSDPETRMALAIGAPEIIRYAYFRDFLETSSLQLLYVGYGSDIVDFSIGPFQMKPSFVEQLEHEIRQRSICRDYLYLSEYPSKNPKEIRELRLQRMQNKNYQLAYLRSFLMVCSQKYADYLQQQRSQQRLKFIATAYNLGLDHSTEDILNYINQAYFPFGKGYGARQYAYGQLAVKIFDNLNKTND